MSDWGKELAYIWANNVAPSRPSCSEICVYTKYLRKVQTIIRNRKIELLVLGSTPEFRDWGFDENLNITVVDKSKEYYDTITGEIRHKNLQETLYIQRWENMIFPQKFDLIVGDLAIGNVDPLLFDNFLDCIGNALYDHGFFIGKSLIWNESDPIKTPSEIIEDYNKSIHIHPYTFINHQLALYCIDRTTFLLDFKKMYEELRLLLENGSLSEETFAFFERIGWNKEMKFNFYSPSQSKFIEAVNKHMNFIKFEYTIDCYTNVFPIFVINRR